MAGGRRQLRSAAELSANDRKIYQAKEKGEITRGKKKMRVIVMSFDRKEKLESGLEISAACMGHGLRLSIGIDRRPTVSVSLYSKQSVPTATDLQYRPQILSICLSIGLRPSVSASVSASDPQHWSLSR